MAVESPPAAVWRGTIGGEQSPVIDAGGTKLQFLGVAARAETELAAVVTANDGRGGTGSRRVVITVAGFSGSAAPSFATETGDQTYELDEAITSLVLPEASGGDLGHGTSGDVFDYVYALSGTLPSGLSFDAATRTLSGTPTDAGLFEMTYTAQDADLEQGEADTASQTFSIKVPPEVTGARYVSDPGDDDTYATGDTIWLSLSVTTGVNVVGSPLPQLAVQVGDEERLAPYTGGTGSTVFRSNLDFQYTVQAGDTDADGVSIDANAFRVNGATLTTARGVALSPEHGALPLDEVHKVDGVRPTVSSATVNGSSLTITFGESLDSGSTPAASAFTVKGIGGRPVSDRRVHHRCRGAADAGHRRGARRQRDGGLREAVEHAAAGRGRQRGGGLHRPGGDERYAGHDVADGERRVGERVDADAHVQTRSWTRRRRRRRACSAWVERTRRRA